MAFAFELRRHECLACPYLAACLRSHLPLDQVMAGGPEAMEEMQKDPETAELLQKLEKTMGSIMP